MKHRILLVDDEPNVLQGLQRAFRDRYEVSTATCGAAALQLLERQDPFAVIVSDMRMPAMDGATLLAQVRARQPLTVRVMLTGNNDQDTATRAINEGSIFRFVTKPCSAETITAAIDAAIRQHQLLTAEKQLLEQTLAGCIGVLTELLGMADERLFSRCTKLRDRCREVKSLIPPEQLWEVESAAMLLPIGSIAIPPVVLVRKRQGLKPTGAELDMIARIPQIGFELLNRIPRLDGVADIVRSQNDDCDVAAGGKPAGAIPFGARLLRILRDLVELEDEDVPRDEALRTLQRRSGYDRALLEEVVALLANRAQAAPTSGTTVDLASLRIGQVAAAPILTTEGTVLVASGQTITSTILERLHNFSSTVGIREPIHVRGTEPVAAQ